MKSLKLLPFLFLCLIQSNQIHAASLSYINASNTNTQYGSGMFANLQGLDWLAFGETKDKTRTEIEGGYKNLLSDGWRYATRNETAALLTSISPIQSFFSPSTYYGNGWFRDIFDVSSSAGKYDFFYGSTGECSSSANESCLGAYSILDFFGSPLSEFSNNYGRSGATTMFNFISNDDTAHSSLLVRNSISSVPIPAAVYLFGAPLLGLFGISRHNAQLKNQNN